MACVLLPTALIAGAAADEWKVARLSGDALIFYHGRWTPLRLGDIVADASFVRTMASGALQFTRDRETIDMAANTEIQIVDRVGQRFTTVRQYFGAVGVEANRENVQHFSVQTPFLAAVVKGTMFAVVTTSRMSTVAVSRGKVGVASADGRAHADVSPGQTATATAAHGFSVGHASASAASAAPSVAAAVASATATAAAASSAAASSSAASASASAAASSASNGAHGTGSSGGSSSGAGDGNGNGGGNGIGHGDGDGKGNGNGNGNGKGNGNAGGKGHGVGNGNAGGHGAGVH